jgi:hypothetical protein
VAFSTGIEVFGNCSSCVASSTSGTTSPSQGTQESWTMGTGYASFPSAQTTNLPNTYFYIRDPADSTNEIVQVAVGGGGSSSWTVNRGACGTTPVAHATGATWVQVVAPGTLQNFKQASNAITTQATISTSTTETVLATHTPQATELEAGATWAAIAYGPITAHGGSARGTLAFNLYWGGSGSVGGAFTLGTGKMVASLQTNANMPPFAATTVIAGASFDVNGEVTWLSSTTAHANLNSWMAAGAALNTAPLVGSCADVTAVGGASGAGPVTIPAVTGPIILTAVWAANYTVYGLTANSMIYRMA